MHGNGCAIDGTWLHRDSEFKVSIDFEARRGRKGASTVVIVGTLIDTLTTPSMRLASHSH